jgi:peptide/nickel transport system permease protein
VIRQALNYAIDRNQLVELALSGHGQPGSVLIPPALGDWQVQIPTDQQMNADPAKAEQLLDEAGYTDTDGDGVREAPDGSPLEFRLIAIESTTVDVRAAELFRDAAEAVGIKLDLQTMDENTLGNTVYNTKDPDWDIFVWGWDSGVADPDYMLGIVLCSQIGGNNDVFYCDQGYDKLYTLQATTVDQGARVPIVDQMHNVLRISVYIVMWYRTSCGRTERTRGAAETPGGLQLPATTTHAPSPAGRGPGTGQARVQGDYRARKPRNPPLFAVNRFDFLLFRSLPGDPVRLIARAGHLSPEAAAQLRATFGLDHSLPVQYWYYLRNLFRGDLGFSITYSRPVVDILKERMVNTLILLGAATVLIVVLGIRLGAPAARRGSRADSGTVGALVFWSLPTFWTGMILLFLFGVWLHAFPISGISTPGAIYTSAWDHFTDIASHLVLPTITLALVDIAQFILITRSSLVDVLTEDFILTAKAKGLPRRRVIWKHGFRNALLPVITASALYISLVVGGAIQVETVFSWPGMGRLTHDAVMRRDYDPRGMLPDLRRTVILANFATDLLYQVLDPRVREA